MKDLKFVPFLLFMILLLNTASSSKEPSITLTRTNVGIVGEKNAELIFSVANMDTHHRVESFMLCKTHDDAKIISIFGSGNGDETGFQSSKIVMDTAPSLKTMLIILEADTIGDKIVDCQFNYILFKILSDEKKYLTNQGTYVLDQEGHYSVIDLDMTVPFVIGMEYPKCPEGKTECKFDEVIDMVNCVYDKTGHLIECETPILPSEVISPEIEETEEQKKEIKKEEKKQRKLQIFFRKIWNWLTKLF